MAEPCIHCQLRPVWKPYSHYVCEECYDFLGRARAQCPCPCHQTNQYPAMCCSDRHLVACPDHIDGTLRGPNASGGPET